MFRKIITIIFGILLLSCVSAIYSGETIYYDFQDQVETINNITFEVVNNTYNLDGLNITINSTGAIVSTLQNYKPDNFTIIFTINGQYEVVESSGQQSGGGSSSYSSNAINIENDYSRQLRIHQSFDFNLVSRHTITYTEFRDSYVVFLIESEPVYIALKEGEEVKLSLEKEGYYDLYLKLNSIEFARANLTIKHINEKRDDVEECKDGLCPITYVEDVDEITKKDYVVAKRIVNVILLIIIFYFLYREYKIRKNKEDFK